VLETGTKTCIEAQGCGDVVEQRIVIRCTSSWMYSVDRPKWIDAAVYQIGISWITLRGESFLVQ